MLNTKPEFVQFAIHTSIFIQIALCKVLQLSTYNNNIVMDKLKSFIFNQHNNTSI